MKVLKATFIILLTFFLVILFAALIGILFLKFYPSVGDLPDSTEQDLIKSKSSLYYDGKFHNPNEINLMSGKGYPASSRRRPSKMIDADVPELLADVEEDDLTFTWIGHSSFLLQMGKKNILVDPVLSERSSPVSFIGPKRFSKVPLTADQMPRIDVLLLSHDHYDHMDYNTIRAISSKVSIFIVPLGVDSILKGWGIEDDRIYPLGWWESAEIDSVSYTLTPSQHFTGRDPLRRDSTLWGGFYIDNGINSVYYTGDGGYCDVFKEIHEKLGAPDLMISECGQYDPSWSAVHMFPEEAVQAALDIKAAWAIPVHWGTFCICNHAWDDPIERVTAEAVKKNVHIATPEIGQTVDFEKIETFNEKWWEAYK